METNDTKKLDPSKPVQTRDGRKARIICTDRKNNSPVVALITNTRDEEFTLYYDKDGNYFSRENDQLDLVNIPEPPIVTYINVYPNGRVSVKSSRETADNVAGFDRVACIRVEYREGQFDD